MEKLRPIYTEAAAAHFMVTLGAVLGKMSQENMAELLKGYPAAEPEDGAA